LELTISNQIAEAFEKALAGAVDRCPHHQVRPGSADSESRAEGWTTIAVPPECDVARVVGLDDEYICGSACIENGTVNWSCEVMLPTQFVTHLLEMNSSTGRPLQGTASDGPRQADSVPKPVMEQSRMHHVVAEVGRVSISQDDLTSLEIGDILLTDTDADGRFRLMVNGQPTRSGVPGDESGLRAVRLVAQTDQRCDE